MKGNPTREKIKAAVKMIAVQNEPEVNVTKVVALAGISRTCFYLHYENLDRVIGEIQDDFIDGLFSIFDGADITTETAERAACYFLEQKEILKYLCNDQGNVVFQEKLTDIGRKIAKEQLKRAGILYNQINPEVLEIVVHGTREFLVQFLRKDPQEKDTEKAMLSLSILSASQLLWSCH